MTAATLTYARSTGRPRRFMFDPVLVLVVAALLLIGLVMVASASIATAERDFGNPFYYLERQLFAVCLGLIAAGIAMLIPTSFWERIAVPLLVLAFVMLTAVLIPGVGSEINGSRRWVPLGVLNLQISEVTRVLLFIYLASYIVRRQADLKDNVQAFLRPLGVLMGAALLLLLEPDFGAATVLMATGLGMLFLAGVKLRHFFTLVVLAVCGMGLLAVTSAYRLKRLTSFLDPWADPFNSGFQLTQSLIAIGRGEFFGVGLGASVQKLFYLPEAHNDLSLIHI